MTLTQQEAIANADAHANNAGLPTYSELVKVLQDLEFAAARYMTSNKEAAIVTAARSAISAAA